MSGVGTSLRPVSPGGTPKSKDTRRIDIHEGDELHEAQLATWVKQAAALPTGFLANRREELSSPRTMIKEEAT
jgi:hypothetical protein